MAEIKLKRGQIAIVDQDIANLYPGKWYVNSHGYVKRRINGKLVSLHRVVMDAPKGQEVDHINGNKLDNRRDNLRFCTRQENLRNFPKLKRNSSGFKGVSFCSRSGKWRARIAVNKKEILIGRFDTKELAADAYNKNLPLS